jgi:hypothetical protein
MATPSRNREAGDVSIRAMQRTDLEEARRILRMAFGTFIGGPDRRDLRCSRIVGYTEAIPNLGPLTLHGAYAAGRISSNLKGSTRQFAWLQVPTTVMLANGYY